jgi:hypothetical protein
MTIAVHACLLVLAMAVTASHAQPAAKSGNESGPDVKVKFQGCPVLLPIEGGCLVVKSRGVDYDINSAQPRPDPKKRLGISGTGTQQQDTVSVCGTTAKPLVSVKWKYTKQKCPAPSAGKGK